MSDQPQGQLDVVCRWLVAPAVPPHPAVLHIRDGCVEAFTNLTATQSIPAAAHDLGDVAVIVGLTNAHTHLEFSSCETPIGEPGMSLPDWIRHVVSRRRDSDPATRSRDIAQGLRESQSYGIAAVGEIATLPWRPEWTQVGAAAELGGAEESEVGSDVALGLSFLELLGLDSEAAPAMIEGARVHIQQLRSGSHWAAGLSPHAPYSVHPQLFDAAVDLAREAQAPMAMHVAESQEELELLAAGSGPFRTMLEEFGVWRDDVFASPRRPLDLLRRLADCPQTLVVHGNYLDRDELEWMADRADRMTLVYCPRTHRYFGHDSYPLAQALNLGVRVALGTDSRGSSPNLNLWEDVVVTLREHSDVDPSHVLSLATAGGARALGRPSPQVVGSTCRQLAVVSGGECRDPWSFLATSDDCQSMYRALQSKL